MGDTKEKKKLSGGIWKKTWERCKSFSNHGQQSESQRRAPWITNSPSFDSSPLMIKSKSWSSILHIMPTTPTPTPTTPRGGSSKKPIKLGLATPKGCLSVYVGPDRQRFVVKVECTNHPLFQMLLEEAELEYGFHSNGPLVLPCQVDVFIKVLFDMDDDHEDHKNGHWGCSPGPRGRTSYHPLSPSTSLVSFF